MPDLYEIVLHDAIIQSLNVDYVERKAVVKLAYYQHESVRERTSAVVVFDGIESISQIANLKDLEVNASAGNVNYWAPAQRGKLGPDTTYIYLVNGCIAVKARSVTFEPCASKEPLEPTPKGGAAQR